MTTRADHVDDLTAEIVSGLDLVPIPTTRLAARPRQRRSARGDLAMVAVLVLVGLITATVAAPYTRGALAEGVRLLERVLRGGSLGGSLPLGTSLAGVRLGTTTDDVLRALGTPSRRSDDGTQWIYDRGIIVFFSGEASGSASRVQRVVAWSGSFARTEEGFSLDGCPSGEAFDLGAPGCGHGAFGDIRAFRETYLAFEVEEWTNGRSTRFEPFRILSVRGLTPDGNAVVVRASFGPLAERIDLSLSRSEDLGPVSSYRIDPFGISACELLARAEVTAGYGEGWGISNHRGHRDANGRVCSVRNAEVLDERHQDVIGDPHLFWYPRPVRPHEVDSLLNELPRSLDKSLRPADGWRTTGSGRWRGYYPAGPQYPLVAVYVEPYFFVVAADEDHVERLADAVRAELTRP